MTEKSDVRCATPPGLHHKICQTPLTPDKAISSRGPLADTATHAMTSLMLVARPSTRSSSDDIVPPTVAAYILSYNSMCVDIWIYLMHKVAPSSELSLANSKCIFRLFWNASSITESAAKAALRHDLWLEWDGVISDELCTTVSKSMLWALPRRIIVAVSGGAMMTTTWQPRSWSLRHHCPPSSLLHRPSRVERAVEFVDN